MKPHNLSLLLAAALCFILARSACAQDLSTLLARKCAGESTWRLDDCAAILHVLSRRAALTGRTLEQMAADYGPASYPSRPWIAALAPSCELPDGWTPRLDWSRHRDRCSQLFALTAAFLRGEVADPCHADHWGSRVLESDVRRARKAIAEGRWVLSRCSTANAFYRLR